MFCQNYTSGLKIAHKTQEKPTLVTFIMSFSLKLFYFFCLEIHEYSSNVPLVKNYAWTLSFLSKNALWHLLFDPLKYTKLDFRSDSDQQIHPETILSSIFSLYATNFFCDTKQNKSDALVNRTDSRGSWESECAGSRRRTDRMEFKLQLKSTFPSFRNLFYWRFSDFEPSAASCRLFKLPVYLVLLRRVCSRLPPCFLHHQVLK